ncbi:MAG: hypothetical protein KDK78_01200, partial [Chlamydiia bacterium]|nr:hypothetical protein [Chlamydiia bacterium]
MLSTLSSLSSCCTPGSLCSVEPEGLPKELRDKLWDALNQSPIPNKVVLELPYRWSGYRSEELEGYMT